MDLPGFGHEGRSAEAGVGAGKGQQKHVVQLSSCMACAAPLEIALVYLGFDCARSWNPWLSAIPRNTPRNVRGPRTDQVMRHFLFYFWYVFSLPRHWSLNTAARASGLLEKTPSEIQCWWDDLYDLGCSCWLLLGFLIFWTDVVTLIIFLLVVGLFFKLILEPSSFVSQVAHLPSCAAESEYVRRTSRWGANVVVPRVAARLAFQTTSMQQTVSREVFKKTCLFFLQKNKLYASTTNRFRKTVEPSANVTVWQVRQMRETDLQHVLQQVQVLWWWWWTMLWQIQLKQFQPFHWNSAKCDYKCKNIKQFIILKPIVLTLLYNLYKQLTPSDTFSIS